MITVSKACMADLPMIMEIYAVARAFMKRSGNGTQWGNSYPDRQVVCDDIKQGQLYAAKDESGTVRGVFAFIVGDDPTYAHIENGEWHSNAQYGTIHRIASDGSRKGIFDAVLDFCEHNAGYLRIDTHQNNAVMQHLIEKRGFVRCGVIYTHDGTPRLAYDKVV